jgi:hypothetical protein
MRFVAFVDGADYADDHLPHVQAACDQEFGSGAWRLSRFLARAVDGGVKLTIEAEPRSTENGKWPFSEPSSLREF